MRGCSSQMGLGSPLGTGHVLQTMWPLRPVSGRWRERSDGVSRVILPPPVAGPCSLASRTPTRREGLSEFRKLSFGNSRAPGSLQSWSQALLQGLLRTGIHKNVRFHHAHCLPWPCVCLQAARRVGGRGCDDVGGMTDTRLSLGRSAVDSATQAGSPWFPVAVCDRVRGDPPSCVCVSSGSF